MGMLAKTVRHLREGTLGHALWRKLRRDRAPPLTLTRFGARTPDDAAKILPHLARRALSKKPNGLVLVAGPAGELRDAVARDLNGWGLRSKIVTIDEMVVLPAADLAAIDCILLTTVDSKEQLRSARWAVNVPEVAALPLEYVALPAFENAPLSQWDRLSDADFISPLLGESGPAFFRIYRESLERFKQKTEIRDYLDVCMLLRSLAERRVTGNIAEFGSFWGHSGYLISRAAEHLGLRAQVTLFDMFENFPDETVGVDAFWSGTHKVDFDAVRANFHDRPSVRFVKGDFTRTLPETETGPLALAFVDCDSYRATRFLLPYLWDKLLVTGGIVALEDYGHAALLGNRVAVHEFFDGRADAYTYFSQFSGCFVAVKLAPAAHAA